MPGSGHRYTYLGDRQTRADLRGAQCDPVRRADGKCIVSTKMATALVELADGGRAVVARRRLRLNSKRKSPPGEPNEAGAAPVRTAPAS